LIIQNNDGKWEAKCELCQWKTTQLERSNAETKLRNHITVVHKKGVKKIKEQKRPTSQSDMAPKIPEPIKEN